MRYTCVVCGSGAADSRTPAKFDCHNCKGSGTMIPIEVQQSVLKHSETRDLKKDWNNV